MPDIATALKTALQTKTQQEKQMQTHTTNPEHVQKIINAWAEDDTRDGAAPPTHQLFKPTNNVSRETFNAVRDNPRLQYKDLVRMLGNRGFNEASIGSLLTQMYNAGMITKDDNGRYTALQSEYTPIKANKRVKIKKNKVAVPGVKKKTEKADKAGIAALKTQDSVAKETPAPTPAFDPEQLLSTLSFAQVMALYKRIKTMVGEA